MNINILDLLRTRTHAPGRMPSGKATLLKYLLIVCLIFDAARAFSQCDPFFPQPLSRRPANYDISLSFDDNTKIIDATQTVRFTNQSPGPISDLRFYLYLNGFKNTESSFLKGASNIFGQGLSGRKPDEWAWVDVQKIEQETGGERADLSPSMKYIQEDDHNAADQSVLQVWMPKPLMPGETAVIHLKWRARMPKTIARAGYSQDFYLFCHWFPQLGVYEQDLQGTWDWNCHQFFRHTEFYADFGVYDVHITIPEKYVSGASGCLVAEKNNGDGTVTRHYHAEDVIDFAWSMSKHFQVVEDRWKDVNIRLLLPPDHAAMGPRYLHALKFAFQYLDEHVGKYPYPSLTVVDPPFHGLRSGLMEYPTLITTGTFYGMPESIRTSESLIVHEFIHQYFMGMVSSNEKEEPWLDEGFATYFEDRIIDAAYGEKHSLIDVLGYRFDNRELTRLEYTTMQNPRDGIVARPGWEFNDHNFKALIYSKTATTLRTVQSLIGEAEMDRIIKGYFERWKFRHPRGRDFMAELQSGLSALPDTLLGLQAYRIFEQSIYGAVVLDYAVTRISNETLFAPEGVFGNGESDLTYRNESASPPTVARVEVQRKGDWVVPVELLVTFADGSSRTLSWSGEEGIKVFEFPGVPKVVSAQIDPQRKIGLDIDLNNNSMTLQPQTAPLWKYAAKAIFWIQNLMQAVSFIS